MTGGGSQLNENFKVEYCELEVLITGDMTEAKNAIIEKLNEIGIPKGSQIILENEIIEIGNREIMAVHFDNLLPEEIYSRNDINDVIEEFHRLLGEKGAMANHRATNEETIVYFKGESFQSMKDSIETYFTTNELCTSGKINQEV